jgi:bifunctional enzyme CysN/CysC
MITGASGVDLAVLLVDARKGMLTQTRRHCYLASLVGVGHVVLAVTKMDLVEYREEMFEAIRREFTEFARRFPSIRFQAIPVSGVRGDNVMATSANMPWYSGPTLMEHLEAVDVGRGAADARPLRLPVQWVNRPHADFRGYAGTLAGGSIARGQDIVVMPSGKTATVEMILGPGGVRDVAVAGDAVTITLSSELDISRGDVICAGREPAEAGSSFEVTLVWLGDAPMLRGRDYLFKIGGRVVNATVAPLKCRVDVNTMERLPAEALRTNEIGIAEIELDRRVAFDPFARNRDTGNFILIDRLTQMTVAAGIIHFALRRSDNVHWQAHEVDRRARRKLHGHGSGVVWLTGLSGAGKSTIANILERRLHERGVRTYILDGDNLRHGLNKDLGFSPADRVENMRRTAEVAKLLVDSGAVVIVSLISPFRAERAMARHLFEAGEFIEVFVDVPLAVAEARDPKGLYGKVRRGELTNFTGVDSPYEPPEAAELRIDSSAESADLAADRILGEIRRQGLIT